MRLDEDIEKMKKSSDSDSPFVYSVGLRCTFSLNVTLETTEEEMTDSTFIDDLMDLNGDRRRFTGRQRGQFTSKYHYSLKK